MEDQINAVKCRRRCTVKNLLKIKRNLMCQTDELINLLKERQHDLCFNIDELCHKEIWLNDDILYKSWLSSPDFKDDLKPLKDSLTEEIDNLSADMLRYDERFEQLNLAIKSVRRTLISSMVEEIVAQEDPKFKNGKSNDKQILIPSDLCTLASNCSGGSKTLSDDSFEVMERTELCEEGMIAYEKHENLSMRSPHIPDGMKCSLKVSEWLHENGGIDKECVMVTSSSNAEEHANEVTKNSSLVPDSMKSSLKVSDWFHKNDSLDKEYTIVTSSSNVIEPENEETKIAAPLQIDAKDALMAVQIACSGTSNSQNQQVPKRALFIESVNNATFLKTENDSSESSAIKDDLKIWLNDDSESRGDKSICIQPLNVSEGQSKKVRPHPVRSDLKTWVNKPDPSAIIVNYYSSPAIVVGKSFASYFVKDNHKEWLCSEKSV